MCFVFVVQCFPQKKRIKILIQNIGVILWRTINNRKRFLFTEEWYSKNQQSGSVAVTIVATHCTRDQTRVRVAPSTEAGHVSVKDTGIGMRVSAVRASISREQGQISGGPKDVPSNSTSNQILHRVLKCGVPRLDICPTWGNRETKPTKIDK